MEPCAFHNLTLGRIDDHEKRLRVVEAFQLKLAGMAALGGFVGAGSAIMVALKIVWG